VFPKTTNSAFKNPQFASALAELQTRDLVLIGIATDACVTATAREAKDLGYAVTLVADACATFPRWVAHGGTFPADTVHQVVLAALVASGMRVVTTRELLGQVQPDGPSEFPAV
jgi:nicotinamidase-related amidase